MLNKPPLEEYFDVEDHGREWHLYCKVCGRGWELKKADCHPGNVLHLLDHARSHKQKKTVKQVR